MSGTSEVAGHPYRVAIAASLEDVIHEGVMLRRAVVVAVPLALLLAALGGAIAATRALRPVRRMVDEAATITATDPRRLTIVNPHDEMGTLAGAFNDLIDRLNDAIDQQRRFMADASHELRTPVSVVRTAADVTLSRDARSESEYRESFRIVGEQARRLSGLVEDMFLLARVDAGQRQIVATDFYFDEIVTECVRSSQVLADARQVTIVSDIATDVSYREMERWRASSSPTCSATRCGMRLLADACGCRWPSLARCYGFRSPMMARVSGRRIASASSSDS